jgi:hypothetical protein
LLNRWLKAFKNRQADQSGYALIIALIIFAVGLLLVPVLLDFVSTGRQTTRQVYENKTSEQYAADAGVAQAMWYIKYQEAAIPSSFTLNLNDKNVTVNISPVTNLDDSITYFIQSTAGSTAINAQVAYIAEVPEVPAEPDVYLFGNAVATGMGGNITLSGAAIINSDSGKNGDIFSGNNISLGGSSIIQGDVYAYSNVALTSATKIDGDAAATGTIGTSGIVTGTRTPGAPAQTPPAITDAVLNTLVQGVYDETYDIGTMTPGGTTYSSGLTIKNVSNVHYPQIYVVGNLVLQNVNTNVAFDSQVYVTGSISFAGTQTVTFSGPVYAGGQIYTNAGSGTIIFQSTVTAGSMNLANNFGFTFNNSVRDLGNLTVGNSSTTSFGNTIYVGGNFSYGGASNLNTSHDMYIKGNLVLSNSSQIIGPQKVVVRGNLTLSGATQLSASQIPYVIVPPARITPALSPLTDPSTVTLAASATASAVLYAPTADFTASGATKLNGSIICKSATLTNSAQIIYTTGLSGRTDLPHTGNPGTPAIPAQMGLETWSIQ